MALLCGKGPGGPAAAEEEGPFCSIVLQSFPSLLSDLDLSPTVIILPQTKTRMETDGFVANEVFGGLFPSFSPSM